MKWSMKWDMSVHNKSLPFDHTCCHDKSELETFLRFPVSRNRSRKLQSELFFLFPLPPTVQVDVVHQHLDLRHKQHTDSCKHCSRGILRIHSDSGGNFCFQGFFIFIVSHFDICTRFTNWFDVITNWCYFSIQSFRWSYERTALPYSFPDC